MALQISKFSKHFFDNFKTKMSFKHAIVSKAVSPLVNESSDDRGFFQRFFFLRRMLYHSGPGKLPGFLTLPAGEALPKALKDINNSANFASVTEPKTSNAVWGGETSSEEVKKIMRAVLLEKVKKKLRNVSANWVQYSEFLRICIETCENPNQGAEFAKLLDDSGIVVVLGNFVFLRPDQVTKSVLSNEFNLTDPIRMELEFEEMVKQKAMIDDEAKTQVRIELYFGLGFLTVWELINWNVMGPIYFFLSFFGFALGYLFLFRISTEFSFQSIYFHRFKTKQERLMKAYNFNMNKYNELCKFVSFPRSTKNLG